MNHIANSIIATRVDIYKTPGIELHTYFPIGHIILPSNIATLEDISKISGILYALPYY